MLPKFKKKFQLPPVKGRISDTKAEVSVNGRRLECSLSLLRTSFRKPLTQFAICVEEEVVGEMISLLSTGQVDVNAENIERLTHVAHQYDIPSLCTFCERLYLSFLSPDCSLELWLLALDKGLDSLRVQALNLIREHFETISQMETFRYIGKSHVEMLILDPMIRITSIGAVHEAIQNWSRYDSDLRAPAKEELTSAFVQKSVSTNQVKGSSVQSSVCRLRSSNSETQDSKLWIVKTESNKLSVCGLCLENGNISPVLRTVSFPPKMEDVSAFWYCVRRNCMYASNETDIWRLDQGRHTWKKCSHAPAGRKHHTLYGAGDKLYALGGYDNKNLRLTEYVLEYDTKKDSWTHHHRTGKLCERVQSGKCVAIDNDIYMFGGFRPDQQDNLVRTCTAQRYNTVKRTSKKLADLPLDCSAFSTVSCAVTDSDYIYILSSDGRVLRYNPASDRYDFLTPYPTPGQQSGAFIRDGLLYIFGGHNKSESVLEIYSLDLKDQRSKWQLCGLLETHMAILSN